MADDLMRKPIPVVLPNHIESKFSSKIMHLSRTARRMLRIRCKWRLTGVSCKADSLEIR